jgi:hypothetical protein
LIVGKTGIDCACCWLLYTEKSRSMLGYLHHDDNKKKS